MNLPGPTDVGVIIGRFQTPKLHQGHKKLFEIALSRHKRVMVILGIPVWIGGTRNPLDYRTRELMIRESYPDVTIASIKDTQSHEEWSKEVDRTIRNIYPLERVTLYGGREGFIRYYTGSFPTIETLEDPSFNSESGTLLREATAALPINSEDFRAGVIYGTYATPSSVLMCVDGVVLRSTARLGPQVLLIRKSNETKWRFPGGLVDKKDKSLADAIAREIREETGIEIGKPVYIDSFGPVADWRTERAGISVHSALFYIPYVYGMAKGGDDAADAQWFNLHNITSQDMESCHHHFLSVAQQWVVDNMSYIFKHTQEIGTHE